MRRLPILAAALELPSHQGGSGVIPERSRSEVVPSCGGFRR